MRDINGVVFLDLKKAFDLVDHRVLLEKLSVYRCDVTPLQWFKSYLHNRMQLVRFKNPYSQTRNISTGVPQGSILGPLLFIIYIYDLPLHIDSNIDMYADDSTHTATAKCIPEIETTLNSDLDNVYNWCRNNRMAINCDKTKTMIVTTQQKRRHLNKQTLDCKLGETDLQ